MLNFFKDFLRQDSLVKGRCMLALLGQDAWGQAGLECCLLLGYRRGIP